jgi:hypothetical protein
VQWLTAKVRTSNSITLTWKKPTQEDCNGVLMGYEVGYQTGAKLLFERANIQESKLILMSFADSDLCLFFKLSYVNSM